MSSTAAKAACQILLTNAGAVSAIGNRRALRIAQEPLDLFRRYASAYARDQAYCCFSAALIAKGGWHFPALRRTFRSSA